MPALQDLDVEWVSLVDRAAVRDPENPTEPMRFLVWKREGVNSEQEEVMSEVDTTAAVEKAEVERDEAQAELQKAQTERDELTKRVDELEKAAKKVSLDPGGHVTAPNKEDEADDINKADLPPAVRARLEKLEKAEAEANERLEKAEKLAKEERDTRINKEFISKAEGYDALSIDPTAFGPVLKAAHESLSSENYGALETLLKATNEQIASSELFKEVGRNGDGVKTGSAYDELVRKSQEIRKSDATVSAADALAAAMDQNPDLQARYLAEIR